MPVATVADPTEVATPSTAPSPTPVQDQVLDVDWAVDFTMTVPGEWTSTMPTYRPARTTGTTFWIYELQLDRRFAITTSGPDTVDEWVQTITSAERMTVTEPQPVEVGSAPGYVLDITPTGEGCTDRFGARECWIIFEDSGYWPVQENRPTRAWVVDVDGETLLIVTDAPSGSFESWTAVVEQALATLEWQP